MKVNTQNINFEVDTGLGITLIFETTNQEKLSNYESTNTKISIKTYENENLNVLGKLNITLQVQRKHVYKFPLICYCWKRCL